MLQQFGSKRIATFLILDSLGTLTLLALAGSLRMELGTLPSIILGPLHALQIPIGGLANETMTSGSAPLLLFGSVAVIWPVFFAVFSVYDGRKNETLSDELRNVTMAVTTATLVLAGLLYLSYRDTSRILFLTFFVMDIALLTGSRVIVWAWHLRHNRGSIDRKAVLIVGAGPVGQDTARALREHARFALEVVGYVDDDPEKQGLVCEGVPVLGTLDQAQQIVTERKVVTAVVALPLRAYERLVTLCRLLQGASVHVYVIPDLFALWFPNATVDGFGGIPVLDLGHPGRSDASRWVKRTFDVCLGSLALVLTLPLLVAVAICIRLDTSGPILYRQRRLGEGGRSFFMYKFRSMHDGADAAAHQAHVTRLITENLAVQDLTGPDGGSLKLADDPRITRVGKVIRRMSIDELPQLLNVIRGEMSLVGPRPPLPYEVVLYQDWHKRRLDALPGITGLWQVRGRNRVSFDEMVRMDLEYIRCRSIWLDLRILLQTPFAVFSGRGAG